MQSFLTCISVLVQLFYAYSLRLYFMGENNWQKAAFKMLLKLTGEVILCEAFVLKISMQMLLKQNGTSNKFLLLPFPYTSFGW